MSRNPRRTFAVAFSSRGKAAPASNVRPLSVPPREEDEVLEFLAGRVLRLLEVAGERGQSVYELVLATELTVQGVLDAIRELQRCGCTIRPRLCYERNLELVFVLRTKLPNIGGAQ
jgi:hypothetical protein